MKVLLTAWSGNVGSHVLRELLRRGHTVRTFTQGAGQLHAGKRFRATSPDPAAVAGAVESADVVIHRAQDRVQRLVRDSGLIRAIFRLADVRSSASAPRTRSCSRSAPATGSRRCTPTTSRSRSPTRWRRPR